jgi:hypothetical protein
VRCTPDGLQEDGQEEERPEQRGADAQHDQVGARPVPAAQPGHGQQRTLAADLDGRERGQLRGGDDEQRGAEVAAAGRGRSGDIRQVAAAGLC